MINLREKGILGELGWTTQKGSKERKEILIEALRRTNINQVCGQLNFILKRNNLYQETKNKIEYDLNFIYENYGYPSWEQKFTKYDGIIFDSREELECYKILKMQGFSFKHQYKIKKYRIDFFIKPKQRFISKKVEISFLLPNIFIEYHPYNPVYDREDKELINYTNVRSNIILNIGKIKNAKVYVARNLLEFRKILNKLTLGISRKNIPKNILNFLINRKKLDSSFEKNLKFIQDFKKSSKIFLNGKKFELDESKLFKIYKNKKARFDSPRNGSKINSFRDHLEKLKQIREKELINRKES